jgi:GAF domain-containing protein
MRQGEKPRKSRAETRRPAGPKSSKEDDSGRRELEKRLAEALEQQTATSEILRVISSSPTDLQPVFDAIASSATRLCDAAFTIVFRFDGELITVAADDGRSPGTLGVIRSAYPSPPGRQSISALAILERRVVCIADAQSSAEYPHAAERARAIGYRSILSVPMLRGDAAIGAINVSRLEAIPFTDSQIALLQTFADQAVIAIENVRLFTELEGRNRDLTATSEILRVISSSPTDVQPVFDVIGERAEKLCDAEISIVSLVDGELIQLVALHGVTEKAVEVVRRIFPMPRDAETLMARAVRRGTVVHVPDVLADAEYGYKGTARTTGQRGCLAVPMVREGQVIGAIFVARRQPGLFSKTQVELLKTFADQAVIAIENVRLFKELEARNQQLTEALDQQIATGEILRVISTSPTNLQPVLDAVVKNAARFCDAPDASIFRLDGENLRAEAHHGPVSQPAGLPVPLLRGTVAGRSVLERQSVAVTDLQVETEEFPEGSDLARQTGQRATLSAPLLREGASIGVILLRRAEAVPFTDKQIALLQTFAAQALIAIENVRLFKELAARNHDLTEALDQQTATSEILRVISASPTDVQPVFEAIVGSACRLCEATFSSLNLLEGSQLMLTAAHGVRPTALAEAQQAYPQPVTPGTTSGRAILERRVVHIEDARLDPDYTNPVRDSIGIRSVLTVPLLREDFPIGAVSVWRDEVRPFTETQTALLQTFADQAVIAIENVRLFKELEEKNLALSESHAQVTEALEQQTATAEILRVISSSTTDVQPVFDTIVRSALRLCDGFFSALDRFDGEMLHMVAHHNYSPEALEEARRQFPARPNRGQGVGRAILDRTIVHIPDVEVDPEYQNQVLSRAIGFRSGLFVPMLRDGLPIGVILVARAKPGPFSESEIELLRTFADQAVIAIENVRLFKELEARTGELTQSVEKLTALGEVSRAVSSTLDVETVLDTIVSRASQLAGGAGCSIYEYDEGGERFELRAMHNHDAAFAEALRATPLRKGEGLMGRAAEMREPVQVADITEPGAYESSARGTLIRFGYRAVLSVPLLREDQIIGSLSFNRKAPGKFPPEVVDVLKTFATQSALAIQNARLFREIADKSAQLEAASRHKSEFLANMSHELRTPLNAIIGFSEILAEKMFGDINEKQTEYLQDILESGRHLLSLINDILDLSKIEAGRMELELSEFDLPQAIENALILVRERASRRGIRLGSTIDERLGMIGGDERKVKQVLLNLLSNALKFTPEGGRIDVSARLDGDMAEVSVADTGIGIAPEDQIAVFEEFRQVGASDKKAEGTGLGLALSRKFIELHGGRIWVKSKPGAGSTFTFTLPLLR